MPVRILHAGTYDENDPPEVPEAFNKAAMPKLEECFFRAIFAIRNYILAKNLSVRTNKVTSNCKISVVSVRQKQSFEKFCRVKNISNFVRKIQFRHNKISISQ